MVRLTSKSVMAIQNACRANAFTIMSTGVSTLRICSKISHRRGSPKTAPPILRNGYVRVLLINISEGRMRTTTGRSHRAASSVAPHSWPKLSALVLDSSPAPGGLPTPLLLNLAIMAVFGGVKGNCTFLRWSAMSEFRKAVIAVIAVIAVAAARVCASAVDFSNGPSRAPSPDQVSAELD